MPASAQQRPLNRIAVDIRETWQPKVHYTAEPYVEGMEHLDKITDSIGHDPAAHVVRYFLSNAKTWRGEDARRIKAELKAML